ncbi:hypothetical protein [Roseivirga sp. E12]|uniref:hypothetical protein n=1 Tax=Roseivirga sp. E12 TaxID=2819237 RepID=UPI001ABCC589|nr:hypothetical protein [Roseivirga sp. E12]MBO3697783.1 hypothetical protein [Roseivirga sp. E12]
MSLLGDLNELKREWKSSSTTKKAFIILSFFLTTNSVASLSDILINWKGFIKDGIEFYRSNVSLPISDFIDRFGIVIHDQTVDVLIIILLTLNTLIRVYFHLIRKKEAIPLGIISTWFITIFALIAIGFIEYASSVFEERLTQPSIPVKYVLILAITSMLLLTRSIRKNLEQTDPLRNRLVSMLWGPIGFACAFILILGAINVMLKV